MDKIHSIEPLRDSFRQDNFPRKSYLLKYLDTPERVKKSMFIMMYYNIGRGVTTIIIGLFLTYLHQISDIVCEVSYFRLGAHTISLTLCMISFVMNIQCLPEYIKLEKLQKSDEIRKQCANILTSNIHLYEIWVFSIQHIYAWFISVWRLYELNQELNSEFCRIFQSHHKQIKKFNIFFSEFENFLIIMFSWQYLSYILISKELDQPKSLVRFRYDDNEVEFCIFCLDEIKKPQLVCEFKCKGKHLFHYKCLEPLLIQNFERPCPICKYSLVQNPE